MFATPLIMLLAFLWILSSLLTPGQLSTQGYVHDDQGRKNKSFLMQYILLQDKHIPDSLSACELPQPSDTPAIRII